MPSSWNPVLAGRSPDHLSLPTPLPPHVVVVSFRFRPNPDDIHGGQDAFVHDLVRELRSRGTAVDVVTFRGRDDAPEAISDGARVHLLETPYSSELTAHEAHRRGTWRLLEVMEAYSNAVERFLPTLRARLGSPLLLLNQDVAEARWVRSARAAGDRIITFGHVFFSEFALEDLTLAEFERMHQRAGFPLPLLVFGRLLLSRRDAQAQLLRMARLFRRPELLRLLPGPARAALEGERAAFVDADQVLFPAQAMRDKVAETYFRADAAEALQVAPWGIGLASAAQDEVKALADRYGIGPEDRVLVTMSRLSPDKRLDALIAAVERVEAEDPALAEHLVVVICGRPSFFEDERYARGLAESASRLRRARVIFAGFQRGSARTAHLALAQGSGRFVQVGRYEAFGLGIAEALSLGLPAITSDTDGAREILDSSHCPEAALAAHVIRPGPKESFPQALARGIVRALGAEPGRDQAQSAAQTVGARFDWAHTIEAVAQSLARVAPAAPLARPRASSVSA